MLWFGSNAARGGFGASVVGDGVFPPSECSLMRMREERVESKPEEEEDEIVPPLAGLGPLEKGGDEVSPPATG